MVALAGMAVWDYSHRQKVDPSEVETVRYFDASSFSQQPKEIDEDPRDNANLDFAIRAWQKALGIPKLPFQRPVLVKDNGADWNTAARAYRDRNEIGEAHLSMYTDEASRSILIHEVGHLLGVPHIADDPLMDPVYKGPLDRPTESAVALAQVALRHRSK